MRIFITLKLCSFIRNPISLNKKRNNESPPPSAGENKKHFLIKSRVASGDNISPFEKKKLKPN